MAEAKASRWRKGRLKLTTGRAGRPEDEGEDCENLNIIILFPSLWYSGGGAGWGGFAAS